MWEHEFYYNTDHPVYGKAGRAAAEAERRRVAEERAEEKRRLAAIEAEKRRAREEREEARCNHIGGGCSLLVVLVAPTLCDPGGWAGVECVSRN